MPAPIPQVDGWREVRPPLPVNRVGTFVRYVEPELAGLSPVRVVVVIRVVDGRKLIVVRAGLVVKSALDVLVHLALVRADGAHTEVRAPTVPHAPDSHLPA